MTLINGITKADAWLLARCIIGLPTQPQQLKSASPLVSGLVQLLSVMAFDAREPMVRQMLSLEDFTRVSGIDPESAPPSPETSDDSLWKIIHASELKHMQPLAWHIPGEIPKQGLTVIYGESGAGKSFIGIDYALRIAQTDRVVYIPTEGEGGYKKRVAAWCAHHRKSEGECYFMFGSITLFDPVVFDRLMGDLLQLAPKLVIIDTLAMALAGGDENNARDMGILLRACRRIIRELNGAVVLVHHVNKGGIVERGSGALRGNADSMIRVSPADDAILIECSKTKDEEPFEQRFMFLLPVNTPEGESLVPVPSATVLRSPDTLTRNQLKLLEIMSLEVNRDGVTLRDLEAQSGLSLGTINRTISNLKEKNLLDKPNGSYAINSAGLKAIGKSDPGDPHNDPHSKPNLADDPLDPLDPAHQRDFKSGSRGSRGSSGSSLSKVDQVDQDDLFADIPIATKPAKSHYAH